MRLFLVFLLIAGVFAAPVALDDIDDDFNDSPTTVAPVEEEKPVENPETAPEPEEEPAVPAENEAPVEVPAETPAPEAEAPVENPEDTETEPEAPVETSKSTDAEAPVDENPPSEGDGSDTEGNTEGETDDDEGFPEDSDGNDDEAEPTVDEEPAPAEEEPVPKEEDNQPAAEEPEAPVEENAETPAPETDAPEAEPEAPVENPVENPQETETETEEKPVVATPTKTGSEATMNDVYVRFVLNSAFSGDGSGRRKYTVRITNQSADKVLCGVTFTAENTSNLAHLINNGDDSISTEPLKLAPGNTANQFTYTSHGRTRPTLTAVTFC